MSDLRALFIPTQVSGVVYWRMYNPCEAALRNRAFNSHLLWWQKNQTELHPWQADVSNINFRDRILNELDIKVKQSDIVVMGMLGLPGGLMAMQGIRECYGKPVVMEIDDNIISCPNYNPAADAYSPNSHVRRITIQQLRESDAIIVTTPYLKDVYSEFNDHVYILPNAIDFKIWGKLQHGRNKGKITIGWVGGANHNDDLLILAPVIEHITNKYPHVEFVFGHGMHPNFRNMKGVRWIKDFHPVMKYPKAVAKMGFDIGIAPLVDNAFNRGKSNLRWLEYSALGIPTVASNVGHFAETVRDGSDGMLCDTPEEFIAALESLITDKSKRRFMGQEARTRVFRDFNIDTIVEQYARVFEEITARGQVTRTHPEWKDSNFKQEVLP